ncbi:hypothetical protein GRF29_1536g979443 [Pseudopithomyces chartarum]|uniref:chitinase n=1 Tax=Pseudopithomyces chartarum TaxID=1892770 RepID=A0AAN6RDQ9_9PLEO|nr:hypothetical protein GRF29_1536g979443 [Pseudopithomyces chartarum]
MLVKNTTWATLLLAASHTTAQTFSLCDPTKKTCPDNPALPSTTYTHDFVASGPDAATWNTTAGNVTYTPSGALFTISAAGEAPTIQSNWYIFFGRVSFMLKASPGTGIVSSAILESDTLDEIDLEWLGGADKVSEVQSNYFGKGNTTTFDRGEFHKVDATQTVARNYTIVWKSDATTWYIDSVPVRTLKFEDATGTLATVTSTSVSAEGGESVSTPAAAAAETQPAVASALAEQEALKPSAVGLAARLDVQAWWYVLLGAVITVRFV